MNLFRSQWILILLLAIPLSTTAKELRVKNRVSAAPQKPERSLRFSPEISVALVTPLFFEDFYDARFSCIGIRGLVSIPVSEKFLFKTGLGINWSQLELTQPQLNFTHLFFTLPLQLHYGFTLSSEVSLSAFAGLEMKALEFDSRSNADGGFRAVSNFFANLHPDFGIHGSFKIGKKTSLLGILSFLYLGGGISFDI